MLLAYENLDAATREYMLSEIQNDAESGKLYMSKRLSPGGQGDYLDLLEAAAEKYDDEWLAGELNKYQRLNETETTKTGQVRRVSSRAHETLAMGEFNSFYIRALCLRAMEEDRSLVVYRARESSRPRPESEAVIGTKPDPEALLKGLRTHPEDRTSKVIPEPNSGLTVKLA